MVKKKKLVNPTLNYLVKLFLINFHSVPKLFLKQCSHSVLEAEIIQVKCSVRVDLHSPNQMSDSSKLSVIKCITFYWHRCLWLQPSR